MTVHEAPQTAPSPKSEDIPTADPTTPAYWRGLANELREHAGTLERNAVRLADGTFPAEVVGQRAHKLTITATEIARYGTDRTRVDAQFRVLAEIALELLGHPDAAGVLAECTGLDS